MKIVNKNNAASGMIEIILCLCIMMSLVEMKMIWQ